MFQPVCNRSRNAVQGHKREIYFLALIQAEGSRFHNPSFERFESTQAIELEHGKEIEVALNREGYWY